MLLDANGRLLGRWNLIDASTLGLLFLVALGIVGVQSGWLKTSSQVVQGETDIEYTILIRNLKTLQPNLFQPGKTLSITIRNQPRGQVKIVAAAVSPKKIIIPNTQEGTYDVIEDPIDRFGYDYTVRLRDHAIITPDGYVTEGIKVKIGLPIEVEGYHYRVGGVIAEVREASKTASTETLPAPDAKNGPVSDSVETPASSSLPPAIPTMGKYKPKAHR